MKYTLLRIFSLLLCICILLSLSPFVRAENPDGERAEAPAQAEDVSSRSLITDSFGFYNLYTMFDKSERQGYSTYPNPYLTLEYAEGMGSLYIIFGEEHGTYTIRNNDNGDVYTAGVNGFIHDFVDLEAIFGYAPASVTLDFSGGQVCIFELYVFTPGEVPSFVQKWNAPAEGATDLVLFSTHGDDEQLFFAGILPYYAGELGYQVQVVYFTDHTDDTCMRVHEMLNGLWSVGVTTYPVLGKHDDAKTDTLESAYYVQRIHGCSYEDLLGFVVEQMRRFKPLVVVAHDFNGEYGHGQHMLYADLVAAALEVSNDPEAYPELAEKYGLWDVPKAYFHLYEENQIVMDWDQPLENFGGMTAFQVTQQLGFPCHISQFDAFKWYLSYSDSAANVSQYSPCEYGLYRTTVGEDVAKNDFFENLNTYAEQARIEEEARLAEEARIAEEARLAEEKRLAAEEDRRASEEARKAMEESMAAVQETTKPAEEKSGQERTISPWIPGITGAAAACAATVFFIAKKRNKK